MATSGGLGSPDSDARMYSYYGMNGIPHTIFDGVVHSIGAGPDHTDGTIYAEIIDGRLQQLAPLGVTIADYGYDLGNAYVTVRVEIFEGLETTAETFVRVGLCEDGLSYESVDYHNILRDMLPDTPLTVSAVGEIQEITIPMVLDGDWNPDELWLWAIVQRDADRAILNAGSSKGGPYAVSVVVDGPRQVLLDGPYTFGETVVANAGIETDTYDLTIDESDLPPGWSAYFTMDEVDYTATSVTLEPLEAVALNVTLVPDEEFASGIAWLNVHSHSGAIPDRDIGFAGVSAGADLLLVTDDGGAGYAQDYFVPALESTGRSIAVWDHGFSGVDAEAMAAHDAVIWFSSLEEANLDEVDRAEIEQFLTGGGRLFLTGQNLARSIFNDGGATWLMNVLNTAFYHLSSGGPEVSGVNGDPISEELMLNLVGGDGADNYDAPDVVNPFGEGAAQLFTYSQNGNGAGTRVETATHKLVFLGFGFESINSTDDRDLLMQRVVEWLVPGGTSVTDGLVPRPAALHQNVPNPFNPQTSIAFNLAQASPVRIAVYDLTGRLVRVLMNETRMAGEHRVCWDGSDETGSRVASGTYLCRMSSEGRTYSRKMAMLK